MTSVCGIIPILCECANVLLLSLFRSLSKVIVVVLEIFLLWVYCLKIGLVTVTNNVINKECNCSNLRHKYVPHRRLPNRSSARNSDTAGHKSLANHSALGDHLKDRKQIQVRREHKDRKSVKSVKKGGELKNSFGQV